MNKENEQEVGPQSIGFATFLLKVLAGGVGGIGGTLILVVIFLLARSLLEPIMTPEGEQYISPIFVFIMMVMIFLASTVGNIVSAWLLALTERDKYKRISSAIYQIFIISVVVFLLMVPVYYIIALGNISNMVYAVALHVIVTAQVSALILEIVSNYKYSLVGVYGITFSIVVSAAIMLGLAGAINNPQMLLFAALPIVWGSIAIVGTIFTILYTWIARTYDKDFLSTQTLYGQDYGKDVESETPEAKKAKDEAGADFLRHN